MKTKTFLTLAILFAVSVLFTTIANGGGLGKQASHAAIEAQLGIRLSEKLPETMSAGHSLQGTILNPEKLSQHGFRNLKRGDKVKIKAIDEQGNFNVITRGQSKNFLLGEKGKIGLTR